ncbi:uncharacterized protein K489DRAFT_113917 [Dissoconium aciculare CBS 342.82]|jgi:hypothetical protein|uniref:GPI anchored protein n=1 Tax=Dissoconium aciculare CBS 342.82 TaxID=1314786 RepID=A0A6J3MHK0_9PEZI|nr:uncharacterized protein K489DRAFT_113917 [Dissoconium aciculare CBS 342.82]KAF1826367.1 hypothetical protein K489DRAFT_113917 [Dissoconium aciculare CBS 342.82]
MASLVLLLLSPLALAQTTTIQLPLFGYDAQAIDASVIGVTSQLTTFSLACPIGADSNECGLFPKQTLTFGPSKYLMDINLSDEFTGIQSCAITSTAPVSGRPPVTALCSESMGGSGANFPGSSTTTYTDGTFFPVRVTAGASLLAAQTGAAATTTSSGPTASNTGTAATGTTGSPTGSAAAPANTNMAGALGAEVFGGAIGAAVGVAGLLFI